MDWEEVKGRPHTKTRRHKQAHVQDMIQRVTQASIEAQKVAVWAVVVTKAEADTKSRSELVSMGSKLG